MSDLHSATVGPQQSTRKKDSAAGCYIIPEGIRHPLPSYTRELATNEDRPVVDLEARLLCLCLISDVPLWKMYIVFVLFCVTSLTILKFFTTDDGALDKYNFATKHERFDCS